MQNPRHALVAAIALLALSSACRDPGVDVPDAGDASDAGEIIPPAASLALAWRGQNHGEAWAVHAIDLDGDGSDELVQAGRGLAAFDRDGLGRNEPLWTVDWHVEGGFASQGGDNDWAFDVRALGDVDGDGRIDLVAATSFHELLAVSGADGRVLWRRALDINGGQPTELTIIDADDDAIGDVFVAASPVAYSGKTGETLWSTNLPRNIVFVRAAQLDADPKRELVVALERDGLIGGPVRPPGSVLHAFDDDGTELFAYTGASDRASALDVHDLDGDGIDEAIVMAGMQLSVVTADGTPLFRFARETFPQLPPAIAARTIDGETRVFLALVDVETGPRIEAWDATGTLRWSENLGWESHGSPNVAHFVDGETPRLLVGTGQTSPPSGFVLAINPSEDVTKHVAWSQEIGFPVDVLAPAHVGDRDVVVAGGQSAALFAIDGAGDFAFTGISGSFLVQVASGDLDGDGVDEVVTLDDHAFVRALTADGRQLWATQLLVAGAGAGTRLAVADLEGDGRAEVIAGAWTYLGVQDPGVIQLFSGDGTLRASARAFDAPSDLATFDLDGDGTLEIVSAQAPVGLSSPDPCRLMTYDAELGPLWSVPTAACFFARIAIGDVDGQPGAEIAYGDATLFTVPHLGLFTHEGATKWLLEASGATTTVAIRNGDAIYGGELPDGRGQVAVRAAVDGTIEREAIFEPRPVETNPESPRPATVSTFASVPDTNGDGVDELIVGLLSCEAALVDGATHATLWKQAFEPAENVNADMHTIGGVAFVPRHAKHDRALLIGLGARDRLKSSVLAVSHDGTILGTVPTQGETRSITVGHGFEGETMGWVGAGLDVHAFEFIPRAD